MLYPCLREQPPLTEMELERYLQQARTPELAALGLPDDLMVPCYGLSVANLPATIVRVLGGESTAMLPPLPDAFWGDLATGVRHVVWIILDAVGWGCFREWVEEEQEAGLAKLCRNNRLLPITSIFPSTSTSALMTLWTGRPPAQHGLVGHMMYLREFGLVADMLMLSPVGVMRRDELVERGLDLTKFVPVPGLGETLAAQRISTHAMINVDLARTGFSRLCFRGVTEVCRFVSTADLWVRLRETLAANRNERTLLVGYLSEPDGIGHLQGTESESWRAELRSVSYSLEREFLTMLSPQERQGTLLVLTADHGQLPGTGKPIILGEQTQLWDRLILPATGSLRAAYLYARQGQARAACEYLQEHLGEQFVVVDSEAALRAGLFGPGKPIYEAPYRLGDLIVTARDLYLLDYRQRLHMPRGMHAGLTPGEMLVPMLLARLD